MSKLTLDEAIKHCFEEAGELQKRADSAELIDILDGLDVEACEQCAADLRQLAEWLTELKEAKRLLKLAVEDFSNVDYHIYECDMGCDSCPIHGERDNCVKWVHADEALKLIGG